MPKGGTLILAIALTLTKCSSLCCCSSGGAKSKLIHMSSVAGSSVRLKACEFHTMMPVNAVSSYTPPLPVSGAPMVLNTLSAPTPIDASPGPYPMHATLGTGGLAQIPSSPHELRSLGAHGSPACGPPLHENGPQT